MGSAQAPWRMMPFAVNIWGWVKTLVPGEPLKIIGLKWMFIPLKMVLIDIGS
jgi:hypothetical protein